MQPEESSASYTFKSLHILGEIDAERKNRELIAQMNIIRTIRVFF